jgi:hypothetical protein
MGSKYRLELVKIGDEKDETLFAIEGPAMVINAGKDLMSSILSGEFGAIEPTAPVETPTSTVELSGVGTPIFTPAEPVKRKRRTKAEMEAARAAGDAPEAGEVASDEPPVVAEPGVETTAPIEQPVTYAPPRAVPAEPVVTAEEAKPYNPFA